MSNLPSIESIHWDFKTDAMRRMAVAVCKLAISKGPETFSANNLPAFDHGGSGVAGVIFHRLVSDGVLSRVMFYHGVAAFPVVVLNPGGNKISVYRLKSCSLALRLIELNGGQEPQVKQEEMAI